VVHRRYFSNMENIYPDVNDRNGGMILLMMEEIKAIAVLTPGVPSGSKIVSVQSPSSCTYVIIYL
jgi:hypothetical protein